ncbi:unnamed protein product, partial [Prorocentrum cordatum]
DRGRGALRGPGGPRRASAMGHMCTRPHYQGGAPPYAGPRPGQAPPGSPSLAVPGSWPHYMPLGPQPGMASPWKAGHSAQLGPGPMQPMGYASNMGSEPGQPLRGPLDAQRHCWGQCCCFCLGSLGAALALLLWVLLRVATAECTLEAFDAHLVLPEERPGSGRGRKVRPGHRSQHLRAGAQPGLAGRVVDGRQSVDSGAVGVLRGCTGEFAISHDRASALPHHEEQKLHEQKLSELRAEFGIGAGTPLLGARRGPAPIQGIRKELRKCMLMIR